MTEQEKAAKRVSLAKDVLAQLEAKKFRPSAGSYIYPAPDSGNYCELCALGSLVVSCCGMPDMEPERIDRSVVLDCLEPTFDRDQLDLIESAFELTNMGDELELHRRIAEMIDDAGSVLRPQNEWSEDEEPEEDRDERVLKLIMLNIIQNAGTFVPEAL